mgnify:CR=1 FL=1|tara:strand:- start:834 stop:1073 length:240 start_codon:yes stop_codon:yes gene_type:complete
MSNSQADGGLDRHDDIYERLVNMHDGLSEDESRKLNAKLILTLINEVGDADTILKLFDMVEANHNGNTTFKSKNEEPDQ